MPAFNQKKMKACPKCSTGKILIGKGDGQFNPRSIENDIQICVECSLQERIAVFRNRAV